MKTLKTSLKFHLAGNALVLMLLGSLLAMADPTLRYQRASERIERRDVRSEGRIENRQERSGERIERRDERITNRIERRDMLFSLPANATAVTVGGTRCYNIGGTIYKPAFYEGETVYVPANAQ